jgi:hypothetical protein
VNARSALLLICLAGAGYPAAPHGPPPGTALVGAWVLDTARSHYGPGADPRRWEHFTCAADASNRLRCVIEGERRDGGRVRGGFTAAPGQAPSRVTGIPGLDAVRVRTVSATIADATFYRRGVPIFGYRAYRAPGGASLVVVSVDALSRVAQTSVIVYNRR